MGEVGPETASSQRAHLAVKLRVQKIRGFRQGIGGSQPVCTVVWFSIQTSERVEPFLVEFLTSEDNKPRPDGSILNESRSSSGGICSSPFMSPIVQDARLCTLMCQSRAR